MNQASVQVGDLVSPINPMSPLKSGSTTYASAVVVKLVPLILVSPDANMRWTDTIKASKLKVVGKATDGQLSAARTKLKQGE